MTAHQNAIQVADDDDEQSDDEDNDDSDCECQAAEKKTIKKKKPRKTYTDAELMIDPDDLNGDLAAYRRNPTRKYTYVNRKKGKERKVQEKRMRELCSKEYVSNLLTFSCGCNPPCRSRVPGLFDQYLCRLREIRWQKRHEMRTKMIDYLKPYLNAASSVRNAHNVVCGESVCAPFFRKFMGWKPRLHQIVMKEIEAGSSELKGRQTVGKKRRKRDFIVAFLQIEFVASAEFNMKQTANGKTHYVKRAGFSELYFLDFIDAWINDPERVHQRPPTLAYFNRVRHECYPRITCQEQIEQKGCDRCSELYHAMISEKTEEGKNTIRRAQIKHFNTVTREREDELAQRLIALRDPAHYLHLTWDATNNLWAVRDLGATNGRVKDIECDEIGLSGLVDSSSKSRFAFTYEHPNVGDHMKTNATLTTLLLYILYIKTSTTHVSRNARHLHVCIDRGPENNNRQMFALLGVFVLLGWFDEITTHAM
ncbi:MAG TPA: hypothetical protein V6C97_27930, partial [Oculatellaceae cyanobacterium]